MTLQPAKWLSVFDLQSLRKNCPAALLRTGRIRDLEKENALLKAENARLDAERRTLRDKDQSLLDASSRKDIREKTSKPQRLPG